MYLQLYLFYLVKKLNLKRLDKEWVFRLEIKTPISQSNWIPFLLQLLTPASC